MRSWQWAEAQACWHEVQYVETDIRCWPVDLDHTQRPFHAWLGTAFLFQRVYLDSRGSADRRYDRCTEDNNDAQYVPRVLLACIQCLRPRSRGCIRHHSSRRLPSAASKCQTMRSPAERSLPGSSDHHRGVQVFPNADFESQFAISRAEHSVSVSAFARNIQSIGWSLGYVKAVLVDHRGMRVLAPVGFALLLAFVWRWRTVRQLQTERNFLRYVQTAVKIMLGLRSLAL